MDQLKNIGPNLIKIKKQNPFKVPERYFEDFSARLSDKIYTEKRISTPVKFLSALKPYLAAAVILIIALLAGNYYYSSNKSKKSTERFYSEISQVVEQELYSYSDETILEAMEIEIPVESIGSSVNSEDMMDYLLNEDLNDEELLNAL